MWFSTDENHYSYHPDAPWENKGNAYLGPKNAYDVCSNFDMVRRVLEENGPTVWISGHEYQASAETYRDVSNNRTPVYHLWQHHYGQHGPASMGTIDVDTASGTITFTSVASGSGTETTVMDVTPAW
jgi:hypothetical protein